MRIKSLVSLKFEIDSITEVLLPRKSKTKDSSEIKWKLKEVFEFIIDEYELRTKFLIVTVWDENNKQVQFMKINLYKIATGPYHHDFPLFGTKSDARLQFDLKISQYVEIKIDCEEVSAEICKKQYPGESFYFSFFVLREEKQQPFESTPSYTQMNPFQQTKSQVRCAQYDECPSPLRIRGKMPPKSLKPNSHLSWSVTSGEMPEFKIFLKAHQIKKSVLHLIIWRIQSDTNVDMFCGAYIPIANIFTQDPIHNNEQSREERSIKITSEGLWNAQEKFGEYSLKLRAQSNKFIKQMKACTRTQMGIIQSIPFYSFYTVHRKESETQKYMQIHQYMTKIQNINKQMNQNTNLSCFNSQKLKDQMIQEFEKLLAFLQSALQSSYIVPVNQTEALKMMDDQSLLLSLVSKVISYSEDDEGLTDICWKIVLAVMKRGQFNLNNIGFSKSDLVEMQKTLYNSYYRKKIKVGIQYQQVQYKLLLLSLKIGYIEGRDDPRQPVEMFRAYSYFRVPEYRDLLLRKVVRKQDQTIQWKANIADGDIDTMPESQSVLAAQLDWQNLFYKPLEVDPKSFALNKEMLQNLEGSVWLEQIGKRKSTFFYFLYFLVSRLSELGKKIKFLKWQYFPGYNKLVRGFLYQMKNLKILQYPQSLKQTSINLLANQKLLNILVSTVFQKTDLNDCNCLMKGLDLISRYLNHFSKNKKLLPPTFNYVYFFKAFKIVLEGQFSYAVVKTLAIIYNNYDNFNVQFKRNLALYLLGKAFFRLFLNWSFPTRNAFYHILILKIQRSSDVFDAQCRKQFANKHDLMNQICVRYDQCIKLIRNALSVRQQNSRDVFKKNDKELHKVLKKKLVAKRRKMSGQAPPAKRSSGLFLALKQLQLGSNNSLHESNVHNTNKFTLNELSKKSETQRSYSVLLDVDLIKSIRNKGSSNFLSPNQNKPEEQNIDGQFESRTKSGTAYNDPKMHEDEWKDSNLKQHKKLRQRKRSIGGIEDLQIREMEPRQVDYLQISVKEFDILDNEIRKHYMQNGSLPICELQVEVPIDEKQIKPQNADFQEWQASQSSSD